VVALAVFVAIASLSVVGAVAFSFLGGDRAQASLDEARTWLAANNNTVMAVLLLVIGVVLISQGLGSLSA
jgi:hypothetical protein